MPLIVVTSNAPGEGKTGVAAAIARRCAYAGRAVKLVRLAGEGRAAEDAAWFSTLDFAPGSSAATVAASDISAAGGDDATVVEADAADAANIPGAIMILVGRKAVPAVPAGITPAAIVVLDVPVNAALPAEANGVPVVAVAEDRALAGFSVADVKALLNAETLVEGDSVATTCDHLVVAPIGSDAGQPYFRRFDSKAVVVRYDKTDQHLAAIRGAAECLILTGGRRPSDYTFDAAGATGVPVLLSLTDTENTVLALEDLFDNTRFQGERKLDRMAEMLDGSKVWDVVGC